MVPVVLHELSVHPRALAAATVIALLLFAAALRKRGTHLSASLWLNREKRVIDNLEQVKLLFDYTKFHITVYTTIATILVAIQSNSFGAHVHLSAGFVPAAIASILLAGLAAGVVAASMPECTGKAHFWEWRTGPYNLPILTIRQWTYLEHTSFWVSVVLVVAAGVVR